jgi:hypothetical protein
MELSDRAILGATTLRRQHDDETDDRRIEFPAVISHHGVVPSLGRLGFVAAGINIGLRE